MSSWAELYAQAKKEGKTQSLAPLLHTFKEEEPLIGRFVKREKFPSKKKGMPDYHAYYMETENDTILFFGGQAFDNGPGSKMMPGEVYAVTFHGKKKLTDNRTLNLFTVDLIPGLHKPMPMTEKEADAI